MVDSRKCDLSMAQQRIAEDWSQYVDRARKVCRNSPHGYICNVANEPGCS